MVQRTNQAMPLLDGARSVIRRGYTVRQRKARISSIEQAVADVATGRNALVEWRSDDRSAEEIARAFLARCG